MASQLDFDLLQHRKHLAVLLLQQVRVAEKAAVAQFAGEVSQLGDLARVELPRRPELLGQPGNVGDACFQGALHAIALSRLERPRAVGPALPAIAKGFSAAPAAPPFAARSANSSPAARTAWIADASRALPGLLAGLIASGLLPRPLARAVLLASLPGNHRPFQIAAHLLHAGEQPLQSALRSAALLLGQLAGFAQVVAQPAEGPGNRFLVARRVRGQAPPDQVFGILHGGQRFRLLQFDQGVHQRLGGLVVALAQHARVLLDSLFDLGQAVAHVALAISQVDLFLAGHARRQRAVLPPPLGLQRL